MIDSESMPSGTCTHDLLIHGCDDELVAAICAFVERGLASGGQVLVHGSTASVALLREAVGPHPELEYAYDATLYRSPTSTLFAYQRMLAERAGLADLWVAGSVPFGDDPSEHPAWTRYESLVNEALGSYPFHALCTYDTRILPASTIAAARATHPSLSDGARRTPSPEYRPPAAFLREALAAVPEAPVTPPTAKAEVRGLPELKALRDVLRETMLALPVLDDERVDGFTVAVNEVVTNGVQHGRAPVEVSLWVRRDGLTCLVADAGPGALDPLTGFRYPQLDAGKGLWLARQLCADLFIGDRPGGGCQVLMVLR